MYTRFKGHKYTRTRTYSTVRHTWEFRGPTGALSYNVHVMDDPKYGDPSCGLEFHHSFDPTGGLEAPDHVNCDLLGGRCWHEGTSLYASETVWPIVKEYLRDQDHDGIFRILEVEYDKYFSQYKPSPRTKDEDNGT